MVSEYVTINTDADAHVSKNDPNRSFGTGNELQSDTDPLKISYLKFDLSGYSAATIDKATLEIKVKSGSSGNHTVFAVSDTSWTESTLTFNNKPNLEQQLYVIQKPKNNQLLQIDLTAYAQSRKGQSLAIAIVPDTKSGLLLHSAESSSRPVLQISMNSASPPTSTPLPVATSTPKPTQTPQPTTLPSATSAPQVPISPIQTPSPTPLISYRDIWISPEELLNRPMSGTTWNSMVSIANGSLGSPNLADQDSTHPEKTLAVALVAARTENTLYRNKVVDALTSAIGTENNPDNDCQYSRSTLLGGHPAGARSLAVGRNLIGYILAADVIDLRPDGYNPDGKGTTFYNWVDEIRYRDNCPDNGSGIWPVGNWFSLSQTHDYTVSNGNALAGASRLAAALYVGDSMEVLRAWNTFQRYLGDTTVSSTYRPNSYSTTWRFDTNNVIGINPKGAVINNYPVDGVLPNDQGRGGSRPSDLNTAPRYTAYPWEGLQGIYAQALMFDRIGFTDPNGNDPWRMQDQALKRAVEYQWYLQNTFGGEWYDQKRAAWVKHLAYYVYGFKPLQYYPSGGGRNLDWTQWTHQP